MAELNTTNRKLKDVKVLFLHENAELAETYEAKSELDPALQRLDIYNVQSIADASQVCRDKNIDLGIVCQNKAFDTFYLEILDLLASRPSLKLTFLLKDLTFEAGSLLNSNSAVLDFKPLSRLDNYESFRELVFSSVRLFEKKSYEMNSDLDRSICLQKGLMVGKEIWADRKVRSAELVGILSEKIDLGTRELQSTFVAEALFFPWLKTSDYKTLTNGLDPSIFEILKTTGNWENEIRTPTTPTGFLVTFANYLADQLIAEKPLAEMLTTVASRAQFLKHPSIRSFDQSFIEQLFSSYDSRVQKVG